MDNANGFNVTRLFLLPLVLSVVLWGYYVNYTFRFYKYLEEENHRQTTAILYPHLRSKNRFMETHDNMALRLCTTDEGKFCQPTTWQSNGNCELIKQDYLTFTMITDNIFTDEYKQKDLYKNLTQQSISDVFQHNRNLQQKTNDICELTHVPNQWFTGGNDFQSIQYQTSGVFFLVHEYVGLIVSFLFVLFFGSTVISKEKKYHFGFFVVAFILGASTIGFLFFSSLDVDEKKAFKRPQFYGQFCVGSFIILVSLFSQFKFSGKYKNKVFDYLYGEKVQAGDESHVKADLVYAVSNFDETSKLMPSNQSTYPFECAPSRDSHVFIVVYVFVFVFYAISFVGGWVPMNTICSFAFWLILACLLPNLLLNTQFEINKLLFETTGNNSFSDSENGSNNSQSNSNSNSDFLWIQKIFSFLSVMFILIVDAFAIDSIVKMNNYHYQHEMSLLWLCFGIIILIVSFVQYLLCVYELIFKRNSTGIAFCYIIEFLVVYIFPVIFLIVFAIYTWRGLADGSSKKINLTFSNNSTLRNEISAYTRHFAYEPKTNYAQGIIDNYGNNLILLHT